MAVSEGGGRTVAAFEADESSGAAADTSAFETAFVSASGVSFGSWADVSLAKVTVAERRRKVRQTGWF